MGFRVYISSWRPAIRIFYMISLVTASKSGALLRVRPQLLVFLFLNMVVNIYWIVAWVFELQSF